MTKIELPDDKPVNLRPKTGEFQGANWALAPMLPQGATSWSLQLTAGADLGSADPRAVDPASRGSLVLADSHASTRMKIVPGGVGMVYAPNDLGYPVGEPVDPDWVSDCDLLPGLCVTDPKRIKRTWTQAGSDMFGTEVDTPVQEELVVFCDMIPGVCNVEILPIRDIASAELLAPMFSVVRTGAGDLGAAAAGDLRMDTPYGYTAGTPSAALRRADGSDPYAQPRGKHIFDPAGGPGRPRCWARSRTTTRPTARTRPGIPSAAATWTSSWVAPCPATPGRNSRRPTARRRPAPASATGCGARGPTPCRPRGGSTSALMPCPWPPICGQQPSVHRRLHRLWHAGRRQPQHRRGRRRRYRGGARPGRLWRAGTAQPRLVAAVGGTGRVAPDGSLALTGGGDLKLRLGGVLNPDLDASQYATQYRTNRQKPDLDGMVTNLRGAIQIEARAIGGSRQLFRQDAVAQPGLTGDAMDPRPINPFVPTLSSASGGITLVPGDSAVYLETMGDLVLSGVSDAGRVRVLNTSIQAPGHGLSVGGGQSWFSLWTPATAINLLSAGGNVTPDTSLSHEAAGSASVIRGTT